MSEFPCDINFIESFLRKVGSGRDFSEDIWIERDVKRPGEGAEGTKANSYSGKTIGKQINNLTELLEDDLDYSFNKGRFVFRFITAIAGSGKSTLLRYLEELINLEQDICQHAILVHFQLQSKLKSPNNAQGFRNNFYGYILAETLWQVLRNQEIKIVAEYVLTELLGNDLFIKLDEARDFEIGFLKKFNTFISTIDIDLEDVFLSVIRQVSEINSKYTFVYLIDELDDALRENEAQVQQIRSTFKLLVNNISRKYDDKIRLLIYIAGTSDLLRDFIISDPAIERRFSYYSIALGSGLIDEFSRIKKKIDKRIEGAYKGCEGFEKAHEQIQLIDNKLKYPGNLRVLGNYCRDYALSVREIYEEYFNDKSEKHFEGNTKQLSDFVESVCEKNWKNYLNSKSGYRLSMEKVPTNSDEHTFRCYAKLFRNEKIVARAYGGVRNYEVLSGYTDYFIRCLDQSDFKETASNEDAPNIAFIISPECSKLLKKRLAINNIQFISSSEGSTEESILKHFNGSNKEIIENKIPIDINMANEKALLGIFDKTNINKGLINKIIEHQPYTDVDDLAVKVKGIGASRKHTIQQKFERNEICFRVGVFISYNSLDKVEVDEIVKNLKENKILCWTDDQLLGGRDVRRELEKIIKSDMLWSAAIFYGNFGTGDWQDEEISALFRKYVKRKEPVIPIVLKSCKTEPKISVLLENLKYIDFRVPRKKSEQLELLVRSIRSQYI
jgi:hypothetical protein